VLFASLILPFYLGLFCVIAFYCLVYVLPCALGFLSFLAMIHFGTGYLVAFFGGFFCGGVSFGLLQWVLETRRSDFGRWVVIAAFVIPAAMAGYGAGLEGSYMGSNSWFFTHAWAVVGALVVGGTAFRRLVLTPDNGPGALSRI
jgi:hypothetical protein